MRSRFGSQRRLRYAGNARVLLALALLMSAFPLLTAMQPAAAQDDEIIVGLITKTETNPFFVKMKEGAQAAADAAGAKLLTGAGAFDADNEGQVTAMENMVTAGVDGILITPGDTKGSYQRFRKRAMRACLSSRSIPRLSRWMRPMHSSRPITSKLDY